jgi:hypothetical protein
MALYHTGSSATVTLLPLFILVCFTASGTSRELQQEAVESNSATAMTQVPQQEAVESNTELLLTGFCCYDGKSQSLVFRKARRSQCCATRVFDLTSECAVTEHMVVRPTLDACVCLPGYVLTSAGKCGECNLSPACGQSTNKGLSDLAQVYTFVIYLPCPVSF